MMLLTATIVLSLIALSALLLAPWSSRGEYDRDAINQALYRDLLRELTAMLPMNRSVLNWLRSSSIRCCRIFPAVRRHSSVR